LVGDERNKIMKSPKDLLTIAKETPRSKSTHRGKNSSIEELRPYLAVLKELKNKNFSFKEMAKWFNNYGMSISAQTMRRSYSILMDEMDRDTQRLK
jgi:hypothetical protein